MKAATKRVLEAARALHAAEMAEREAWKKAHDAAQHAAWLRRDAERASSMVGRRRGDLVSAVEAETRGG